MSYLRRFATPLTIGTTLVAGLTGVLLFFHTRFALTTVLHEWVGMAMVAAVVLHLILNWRAFTGYFKRPVALAVIGLFAALTAASVVPTSSTSAEGDRPDFAVIDLIASAPVEEVAPILDIDMATLTERLAAQGITVTPGQSLADMSGGDTRAALSLLSSLKG